MKTEGPKACPLKEAYQFGAEHGLQAEIGEIRTMEIEWDLSYTSTLRRGYIIDLFQQKGILNEFVERYWPNGATEDGQSKTRRYLIIKRRYESFLAGNEEEGEQPEDRSEHAFAAETDLRNFLAQNLDIIEPGLRLYKEDERDGVEYPVEAGRIDILALDQEGKFVVTELKLSLGRSKTLGQLLYYMGWVDVNLGRGPCRGVIIAREISDDLRLAAKRAAGILLYQYHLKVSVQNIL